jgi:S-ribosylhomocysteine lyase LuxS involved in autoinducer biosynthesis
MSFGDSKEEAVLFDLVGYSGLNEAAKAIVDGDFLEKHGENIDIHPETEQHIKELMMTAEIHKLGKKVAYLVDEHNSIPGLKLWKESTSTSPSGCHLGHYKAMINDPD